ncbi:MAG: bifunctional precorrin-2 dehydrogenase/sirohydrochlorin ferrochelatase [Deltaproteobacteria bacterium]|nr:MAG: bifunctional precorrin-2 dehydrogenase/sirohydrochlorin ferrochelatase [Deltaproteobacteria bacterium]
MGGYPIILDLADRLAVVVGGGAVGRRKVAGLLEAGARVRLVTREPVPPGCWQQPVELRLRPFHPVDLDDAAIAFAATGIAEIDRAVRDAARERRIPVNLAASPADGDFALPAVLRRGDLLLAVATGGRAPALAGVVRDRLAAGYGPEWGLAVEIAARLRTNKLTASSENVYSYKVLADLVDNGLIVLLARRDETGIGHLLTRICGRETTLAGLGLTLPD